jgi:hypothetical protein
MTDYCPNRRSDVLVRVVEGETVVLDRQGGLIHQFNRTVSYIWDRCDGRSTLADITHQLVEAFDVEAETVAADTASTIAQFHRLSLLEPCEGVAIRRGPAGEGR